MDIDDFTEDEILEFDDKQIITYLPELIEKFNINNDFQKLIKTRQIELKSLRRKIKQLKKLPNNPVNTQKKRDIKRLKNEMIWIENNICHCRRQLIYLIHSTIFKIKMNNLSLTYQKALSLNNDDNIL